MSSPSDAGTLARNRAQTHFKAAERRDETVRAEIEKERAAVAAKTAKLRAMRLARDAAEKAETAEGEGENAAAPAKKRRKTARKAIRVP